MQKNNKIASILLWSIFISMVLSILFISISTKITKTLKNNDNILQQNQIKKVINQQIKNNDFSTKQINKNTYLIFQKLDPYIIDIKNKKTKSFLFNSWTTINLKIEKIYWADLYYKLYQSNNKNNINNLVWSWIISNNIETTLLNSSNNWWKIILKNLWWESKIKIYSQNSYQPKYINYKIVKIIWNNILTQSKNTIKLY